MGAGVERPHSTVTQAAKWYPDFAASLPSMHGKTVAITGTTSGTGFVAAQTVLHKGGRVILLNRPSDRAASAEQRLRRHAASAEDVVAVACDLQDFASVRKAAEQVDAAVGAAGLDVLVNNAGARRDWQTLLRLPSWCAKRPRARAPWMLPQRAA